MLNKILVAMDFSPAWPQLRQRLLALHEWGANTLVLVHVLSSRYPATPEESHREHYQQALSKEAEALQQLGFQVSVELRVGEPGAELVAASQAHGCELLLLGSSGHGHIHEFLLGSTVLDVARLSCRPLWLEPVGKQARSSDGGTLLLATDGSPAAAAAEAWFAWLRPHFSKAIAMTVIGRGSGEEREQRDLAQHLKLLCQDMTEV
jgi:nucleotide-binding universal stress UspA family protein